MSSDVTNATTAAGSSAAGTAVTPGTTVTKPGRAGRWIDDWRPEDPSFWENGGRRVAWRNLVWSVTSEHIGFSIWSIWSVMVLFLGPAYGIDPAGKFLLTALPTLVGATLRLPYTFAVATFGGRNFTIAAALLLLIPTIFIAIVLEPGVSYTTLLIAAATAGVGGGNFASSMTNINSFYPQREKGWALGLNAGGGNLGVAVVQLIGLLVLATAGVDNPRVMVAIYIPLIVIAALGSALKMDNLTVASNAKGALREVCRDGHTWIISLLYIGTFGSFIGFGFAFGQVLQVQFTKTPLQAAYLTFLGPLLGSLIRPYGGMLADRLGGSRVTFFNFIAMAVGASVVLIAALNQTLPLYLAGFILLFIFSGLGNGSVYKMIPAIFAAKAAKKVRAGTELQVAAVESARLSGALIGIAGAIGAFGGVLVNLAFRQSFLATKSANAAYVSFIVFYAICFVVTYAVYIRKSDKSLEGV
ncbi:nitrate/nitrite transporter [Nakamurella deserti]|uniref:nitrate/nitrite transporter n=1 Tax=Nakamurella deserti TaxID=2164074 RepID=UPI000DBE8A04|nr:nitrate/nitrite transporter [Nakamurella deserti]